MSRNMRSKLSATDQANIHNYERFLSFDKFRLFVLNSDKFRIFSYSNDVKRALINVH